MLLSRQGGLRSSVDEALVQLLRDYHGPLLYGLVALSALLEYVAPPLPGDTVALVAIFWAATAKLDPLSVYVALCLGAIMGGVIAWRFGIWLADNERRWPAFMRRPTVAQGVDAVRLQYAKRGPAYLAANRFIPAFRAFFFVAAGVSRMRFWPVVLFGALSAVVYNALLLAAGYLAQGSWEQLKTWFSSYALIALMCAVVVIWLAFVTRNRARS